MMFWYDHGGMGGWGWAAMGLSTILFWALVIGLGVLIFRAVRGGTPGGGAIPRSTSHSGAEQVLAERFARGEIDEDEYQRRLATLRGTGSTAPGPTLHK